MKRLLAIGLMAFSLSGCQNLANTLAASPTVQNIVNGIRTACNWEANSSDVQNLLNSGIIGLKTVDNYVGAVCGAIASLPIPAPSQGLVAAGPPTLRVGGVVIHGQPAMK